MYKYQYAPVKNAISRRVEPYSASRAGASIFTFRTAVSVHRHTLDVRLCTFRLSARNLAGNKFTLNYLAKCDRERGFRSPPPAAPAGFDYALIIPLARIAFRILFRAQIAALKQKLGSGINERSSAPGLDLGTSRRFALAKVAPNILHYRGVHRLKGRLVRPRRN